MKRNYSKNQPSTTAQDSNDFYEAIKDLKHEERLNFLVRLMYGREIIVMEDEVFFKVSFDSKGIFKKLYPYNKRIGMEILLNSLNPHKILYEGRNIGEISGYYWFGFLNYMIDVWTLEKVESIVNHLNTEEYNAIKISLILKHLNQKNNPF